MDDSYFCFIVFCIKFLFSEVFGVFLVFILMLRDRVS